MLTYLKNLWIKFLNLIKKDETVINDLITSTRLDISNLSKKINDAITEIKVVLTLTQERLESIKTEIASDLSLLNNKLIHLKSVAEGEKNDIILDITKDINELEEMYTSIKDKVIDVKTKVELVSETIKADVDVLTSGTNSLV